MADRQLLLYWNEISIPADITAEDLQADPQWAQRSQRAFATFLEVLRVRPDCRISFTKGTFHGHVADRPLQSWLEDWLGKDRWRKLQVKAVQPTAQDLAPMHTLECELLCNGRCGEGITRAHIADSWTWSIASETTGSTLHLIRAEKITIETDTQLDVDVRNLAATDHFEHWKDALAVWGEQLSNNHVVAVLGRYQVIMYPFDHGHAHIHVHAHNDPQLNAKYRIDKFERLTNAHPEGLDELIGPWIDQHREQLVQSWSRCQAGRFPLKLEN